MTLKGVRLIEYRQCTRLPDATRSQRGLLKKIVIYSQESSQDLILFFFCSRRDICETKASDEERILRQCVGL